MRPRSAIAFKWSAVPLVPIALLLLVLRLIVFFSDAAGLKLPPWRELFTDEPETLLMVSQLLVSSLIFEVAALGWLVVLARRRWGLWPARLFLLLLLVGNVAGTQTFLMLRTYAQGFQLWRLPARELASMAWAATTAPVWTALVAAVGCALLFARSHSWELATPEPRSARLLGVFGVVVTGAAVWLVTTAGARPAFSQSPVALLVAQKVNAPVAGQTDAKPAAEDWAPPRQWASQWAHLESIPRKFNVVVVVLESVRFGSFWPVPGAPAMPSLAARENQAAIFTRAYAHEPLSVKGLEALLFGIYPAPFWESAAERKVALDSVPRRWKALGLRTGFFGWGEVPFTGDKVFLREEGFGRVVERGDLMRLDPQPSDRTLVTALERFLDEERGEQFGAFLWPHTTHLPYQLPEPLKNQHPKSTYGAYLEAVAYLDGVFADLFALLERRQLAEKTVVVLVADHGESFGEQPESGHAHGDWLYETNTHIPLVLFNPVLFKGERDHRLVQQKDVAATLAFLAGDARPRLNVGNDVFHERVSHTAYMASHLDVSSLRGALVREKWKYIFQQGIGAVPERNRLYDLQADPGEKNDLWAREPEVGRALRERYLGWLGYWSSRWIALDLENQLQNRERVRAVLGVE